MRDEFWLEDQSPDLFDIADDQTPDSFGAFSGVLVGPPGPPGPQGPPGADGTVSFDELTPAQRESLRGEGVPAGGTTGQVLAKASNTDYDTEWVDQSGGSASMTILSYGHSTWNDFITAYNSNSIVYCRASSAADPSSGSQTRLAFMAYVNNASSPTSVEFQYYRSVSGHTASQQGDQVYIYKLTSGGVWSVTVREAYTKIVAGTNMSSSYANGTLTLNATGGGTEDALPLAGGTMSGAIDMGNNKITNVLNPTNYLDAANKNYVDARYIKPSSGIPKSDLASAVQTSLGKADTALQSVPSTYRTAAAQDAIDEGILGNLAMIESSPVTAAHAVGEYIVYNGQLYKVTAAISPGETLTPGTNISAVSNGGLNDLKRIVNYNPALIASGVGLNGAALMTVYGNFFFFRAVINVTTAQSQYTDLFQMPNYNYDTTTTNNVLVNKVDGTNGYTTVSIVSQKIMVMLSGGMTTGRYEILLFGKCT